MGMWYALLYKAGFVAPANLNAPINFVANVKADLVQKVKGVAQDPNGEFSEEGQPVTVLGEIYKRIASLHSQHGSAAGWFPNGSDGVHPGLSIMGYAKDGYPTELANKVGHIKLIQDPMIQRMIECFEDYRPAPAGTLPTATGNIQLDGECPIRQVITVDGGHQAVPNIARPERQVGFVQVAAQMVKMETIEYLSTHPMADPREVRSMLGRFTHHTLAALPLTGVHIPGLTVRQSLRETIHRFLSHYQLYEALSFLVYWAWQAQMPEAPSMACLACGEPFDLPRHALRFPCPHCAEDHNLSDYLGLVDQDAEDHSNVETVSNLRTILEALVLFSFIVRFRDRPVIMNQTLFLLDGPLTLRAQLARLVEPIRALIADRRANGQNIYLVGVEKNGQLRSFADSCSSALSNGDYFLPRRSIFSKRFTDERLTHRPTEIGLTMGPK